MTRRGLQWTAGLSLLLLPLAVPATQSAPRTRLTLQSAIEQALTRRPALEAAQHRVEAAKARTNQARAGLMPRLDIQGSATDGPPGSPPLFLGGLAGTAIKKHTGGSLNLVQTLLDFGRTRSLTRARQAEAGASAEALRAARQSVVLEVRQAYLQVLQARRLITLNRRVHDQRQSAVKQAGAFLEAGVGTRLDVDLAQLLVSQAKLAIVRAEADEQVALAALSRAIGLEETPEFELEEPPVAGGEMPQLIGAVSRARAQRPELSQLAAQVRAQEHLTAAARAGKRPILTGVGSVGKVNPSPLFADGDKPWAVGLGVTIPVFTGGLVEAQIAEARRNGDAARASLLEMVRQVDEQVRAAIANLRAAVESGQVAEAQLVLARDALSLAEQRYQSQLGTIVELSQAQVALATAETDVIRARFDRELALTALDFAMGQPISRPDPAGAFGPKP